MHEDIFSVQNGLSLFHQVIIVISPVCDADPSSVEEKYESVRLEAKSQLMFCHRRLSSFMDTCHGTQNLQKSTISFENLM